jgi:PEGA domain
VQPVASAASPDVARALTTTKSAVDGSSAKPSRPLTKKRTPADEHAPAAVRDVTREEGTENRRGGLLGTLVVASQPRGARVTVDGIPRGKAPVSIARLRAGNRLVRLEMDGYQRWSWSVYISPDRPTRLNVDLVPNRNPPAPSGPRASLGGR